MTKYKCLKCNHTWPGRTNPSPLCCPKCKRYDWGKSKGEVKNGRSI